MKNHKKKLKIASLIFLVFCLHIISFYIKKIPESKSLKHDASTEETDRVGEYIALPSDPMPPPMCLPCSDSTQKEMFNKSLESIDPLAALTDEDLSNIIYILENDSDKKELVSKQVNTMNDIISVTALNIRYSDYKKHYEWLNEITDIIYVVTLNESYNEYNNDTEIFCQNFIVEEITWYDINTIRKKACKLSNGIWMIKGQKEKWTRQASRATDSQNEKSGGYSQNGQNLLDGSEQFPAGGALLGQAIGNNTESTLIGGILGYVIGNEMDKYDRHMLNQAYESTPSGQTKTWVNPDHGNQYMVTPQQAYIGPNNQQCRKAEILAVINGRTETTYATACRNINGQWQLQ